MFVVLILKSFRSSDASYSGRWWCSGDDILCVADRDAGRFSLFAHSAGGKQKSRRAADSKESWRAHCFAMLSQALWPALAMQTESDSATLLEAGYGQPPQQLLVEFRTSELVVGTSELVDRGIKEITE